MLNEIYNSDGTGGLQMKSIVCTIGQYTTNFEQII